MHDTLRSVVLTALLATSATAWADFVKSTDPVVSPVPLLALSLGKLVHVSPEGTRVVAECEQVEEYRILSGREKGVLKRETAPCSLWNLAVHPTTGRWAMSISVSGNQKSRNLVRLTVSGRDIPVPRTAAGYNKGGSLLVMGDLDGVVAVTPGRPETWMDNGLFRDQAPKQFTEDGSRVLTRAGDSTYYEWWSWSFGARPEGILVLKRHLTDTAGVFPVQGELRTVLRHPSAGLRIATMDPTGTQPWKVGPALKNMPRKGMLVPYLLGDTLLYYREGHFDEEAGCDESRPGTYRRLDLRTGEDRVWRTHETWCSTGEFEGLNPIRRTLYFIEGFAYYGGGRIYEYSLDRDEVRELGIQAISDVLDISPDGSTLLVRTGQLFQAYHVDTGELARVDLADVRGARVLAPRD